MIAKIRLTRAASVASWPLVGGFTKFGVNLGVYPGIVA